MCDSRKLEHKINSSFTPPAHIRADNRTSRAEAMKFREFEHDVLPRILIPLLGGLFVLCAIHTGARAAAPASAPKSFIVSAADGYGVNECIKTGDECARIVADAWCEAHGYGAAKAFGRADDVTGAIEKTAVRETPAKAISEDDIFILCNE
jgi:hypothetical protein